MQKKTYSIVGTNHTKKEAFVASLKPGKPVLLVREPRNQYDPCAIAVYIDGEKVGYIPRNQNRVIASFIDQSGQPWDQPVAIAQDSASATVRWGKTLPATFTLSPNSAFPQVEV